MLKKHGTFGFQKDEPDGTIKISKIDRASQISKKSPILRVLSNKIDIVQKVVDYRKFDEERLEQSKYSKQLKEQMKQSLALKQIEEKNLNDSYVTHIENINSHFQKNLESLNNSFLDSNYDFLDSKVKTTSFNQLFEIEGSKDKHFYVFTQSNKKFYS